MRNKIVFFSLATIISACGVKGDPVSPNDEAIISDGIQQTTRNNDNTNLKRKQSPEEESNENKKNKKR